MQSTMLYVQLQMKQQHYGSKCCTEYFCPKHKHTMSPLTTHKKYRLHEELYNLSSAPPPHLPPPPKKGRTSEFLLLC